MNMLDVHTREKVNKIHIAEMQEQARHYRLLRGQARKSTLADTKAKVRFVLLAGMIIGMLVVSAMAVF